MTTRLENANASLKNVRIHICVNVFANFKLQRFDVFGATKYARHLIISTFQSMQMQIDVYC